MTVEFMEGKGMNDGYDGKPDEFVEFTKSLLIIKKWYKLPLWKRIFLTLTKRGIKTDYWR